MELLETTFNQLSNISTINNNDKIQIDVKVDANSTQEEKLGNKLKQFKETLVSSILDIYRDYEFNEQNDTVPKESKTGAQLLDPAVKKLRNNLDSSTEGKRLNDILTKQAVVKHLKKFKTLESMSSHLYNDMVNVRQETIQGSETPTQIPDNIIEYISKSSKNFEGKKSTLLFHQGFFKS